MHILVIIAGAKLIVHQESLLAMRVARTRSDSNEANTCLDGLLVVEHRFAILSGHAHL